MTPAGTDGVEAILRDWLADAEVTLFCGDWSCGGLMELLPRGRARLSGPRYDGAFAGLRELRLDDDGHHVHLDLGRLSRACYVVVPSVCYGFRPAFELRLAAAGDDPFLRYGLGLATTRPYVGGALREAAARRYFDRVARHLHLYPDVASLHFRSGAAPDGRRALPAERRSTGDAEVARATSESGTREDRAGDCSPEWAAIDAFLATEPGWHALRGLLPVASRAVADTCASRDG